MPAKLRNTIIILFVVLFGVFTIFWLRVRAQSNPASSSSKAAAESEAKSINEIKFSSINSNPLVKTFELDTNLLQEDLTQIGLPKIDYTDPTGSGSSGVVNEIVFDLTDDSTIDDYVIKDGISVSVAFNNSYSNNVLTKHIYIPNDVLEKDLLEAKQRLYWAILWSMVRSTDNPTEAMQNKFNEVYRNRLRETGIPLTLEIN